MAGIGFHLKNMLEEEYLSSKIRAYAFACMVTSGPWIIVTLTIFMIHWLAGFIITSPFNQVELFTISVSYCFIFSQIVFGTHQLVVSRYVADLLFTKKKDHIFPTFLGVSKTITMLCAGLWLPFFLISSLPFTYKGLLLFLFITINLIWVLSLFLTASKDFKKISIAYLTGGMVALFSSYLLKASYFESIAGTYADAFQLLFGFTLGMLVALFILFHGFVQAFSPEHVRGQFDYVAYFKRYPSLFIIGLFYNAGLWISTIVIWFGTGAESINRSFIYHPHYDTALFWSFLTIIPAVVLFTVAVETRFYKHYRVFYHYVNHGGTLQQIEKQKASMVRTLSREVEKLIKFQAIFTLVVILLSGYVFNLIGVPQAILSIFKFTTLGAFFTVLFLIMIMLHLYFENRKGAMYGTLLFFSLNFVLTLLLLPYGYTAYGVSFATGSSLAFFISAFSLIQYLKNVEYHAFLGQGTMNFLEKESVRNFVEWLNEKQSTPK